MGSSLRVGLLAGSIGGVVAALVSLPLESPHDGLLNTGSVAFAALVTGVATGLVWRAMPAGNAGLFRFILLGLLAFGIVVGAAFAAETQLERSVSFVIPLAGIILAIQVAGVPLLAKVERLHSWWVTLTAVVVVVALGASLAGVGDQESGRLELPPRSATIGAGWLF